MLGYGGITNIRYPRLFEAAMSGPVGGLMGARYLGSVMGEENIVCSDVGGTSFDAGTIRITSYNVCYTKLLRGQISSRRSG